MQNGVTPNQIEMTCGNLRLFQRGANEPDGCANPADLRLSFGQLNRSGRNVNARDMGSQLSEQHGIDPISAPDIEDLFALEIFQNAKPEFFIESPPRMRRAIALDGQGINRQNFLGLLLGYAVKESGLFFPA